MGLEELRSAPFASTPIDEHAAKTKTKQGPEEGRSQHGAGGNTACATGQEDGSICHGQSPKG